MKIYTLRSFENASTYNKYWFINAQNCSWIIPSNSKLIQKEIKNKMFTIAQLLADNFSLNLVAAIPLEKKKNFFLKIYIMLMKLVRMQRTLRYKNWKLFQKSILLNSPKTKRILNALPKLNCKLVSQNICPLFTSFSRHMSPVKLQKIAY